MSEFHLKDPDLKNSRLEIGFPSWAIEKDNFIDSQGKLIGTEYKESFQANVWKQRTHLCCPCNRCGLMDYSIGTTALNRLLEMCFN